MDNTVLTKENIQNIISGRENNPFAFLGKTTKRRLDMRRGQVPT